MGTIDFAGAVWRFGTGLFHGTVMSETVEGKLDVGTVRERGLPTPSLAVADVMTTDPGLPARHPRMRHMPHMILADLPRGIVVTRVRERGRGAVATHVECKVEGRQVDHQLTPDALREMIDARTLVMESSSGNDQGLHHRYDHFVVSLRAP